MPFAVERRHEFMAVARGAHRKLLRSSQFEPNALEHVGERHGRTPLRSDHRIEVVKDSDPAFDISQIQPRFLLVLGLTSAANELVVNDA